jgi:PAS domain S-box-containing protein
MAFPYPDIVTGGASPSDGFSTEARFQALFEQAPTSMQLLAADGTTIQVNRAWRTLWDMPDGSALSDYVLSGAYNVLTDLQLRENGVTPYLERACSGASVKIPAAKYDPAALGKPGRTRWVTATAHPLKDGQGRVREVLLMHEDITDQVEAERLLRDSEERFRSLVTATSAVVWTMTAEGLAYRDSPSWRAFTGQTPEDWKANGWLAAVHPDDRAHALHVFHLCIASRTSFDCEYRLRRADGRYCWTSAKAVPILNDDGSVREWIGANTDITEARDATLAMQASAARFRTLAEALPQMVWSTRPDGYHEYYNQKWHDFTGVPSGSMNGEAWEQIVHPDDQAMARRVWQHSLHSGDPYEIQYRLRHHSGQYRWALGRALPVRDDSGAIVHWFGTCTDIHDQKQAEDALREAARRKDDFLAMLAHELRNPLAPISAAAELLELVQLDPHQIKQTSKIINRQVRHLMALVDDLLDVSRVTRGLVQIDQSPQDLKLVAAAALEQVTPLLEARRHHLTLDLTRQPAYVLGDQKRLVQVLTNLLNNAVKYTPDGGNIHLGIEATRRHIVLRVRDDGIGMAPDLQPRVFDLFTQADRSADRAQGGLGIGLALVKSLVERHGGEVRCASKGVGLGSEFMVMLPRLPDGHADVGDLPLAQLPGAANPLKILVVDDNADAAMMLAMYLDAVGHEVTVEHTPAAALAAASTSPPDVCILDIGLPEMDGYELASRLKQQPATSQATLIAVTGYGQERDRQRSVDAGFACHLVKPVDTAKLIALLSTIKRS